MQLEAWLTEKLNRLEERNLFRKLPPDRNSSLINFSTNDYLGLSNHPKLKEAAIRAAEQWGVGSGASRLISGTFFPHTELEKEMARWYGKEAALLFNSGYHAGIGLIPVIAETGVLFSDELNHACLIDGCRLSRAEVVIYRHRDMKHLEELLRAHQARFPRWILSESLFSMDGTTAPCAQLVELKQKYGAFLLLDEAHAVGVYGQEGRGVAEESGCLNQVDLLMGTFSKAMGSFGGFSVGSQPLITYFINCCRSFLFSTALPPAVAAANLAAVSLVRSMEAERTRLRRRAKETRHFFQTSSWEVRGEDSPIIPVIIAEPERALQLSARLREEGIWIPAIRPPTVPEGSSRLRVSLSAAHSQDDYEKLFAAFRRLAVDESVFP